MSLGAGTRLGPYEISGPIGSGGMGDVYRARDTRLGREIAVKVLPAAMAGDPDRQARFEREARVVASLSHPHICAIYDVGRQDAGDASIAFLVMELLEGETLAERLARRSGRSAPGAGAVAAAPRPRRGSSSGTASGSDVASAGPARGRALPLDETLRIATELGVLEVEPQQVAVIPRGVRFAVSLPDGSARGYVCENFGALLRLPDLGPIGSNGLANPRDFETPCAAFEDVEGDFELVAKFQGHLWRADIGHSPLDVVGWHGNYAPYRYDLRRFNTIGSISFDHPDPSIFLVLHSPSDTPGTSNMDFVIFPPRWLVAQDTFRPPWFHRNVASEFMGLVHGAYDAKAEGFVPGGASLHNSMTGHGPDAATFEKASAADLARPDVIADTMAFMFETRAVIRPTRQAIDAAHRQRDYQACWAGLKKNFAPR